VNDEKKIKVMHRKINYSPGSFSSNIHYVVNGAGKGIIISSYCTLWKKCHP